jgi:hypothetical protein
MKNEVTQGRRKLRSEELRNLCSSYKLASLSQIRLVSQINSIVNFLQERREAETLKSSEMKVNLIMHISAANTKIYGRKAAKIARTQS